MEKKNPGVLALRHRLAAAPQSRIFKLYDKTYLPALALPGGNVILTRQGFETASLNYATRFGNHCPVSVKDLGFSGTAEEFIAQIENATDLISKSTDPLPIACSGTAAPLVDRVFSWLFG